jgi:LmbE family N-acetylglucosaminyl deacetylase
VTVLAPHNDDEALFAAYTLLRHRPRVVVVLDSGPERTAESRAACAVLGVEVEQWPFAESDPDWDAAGDEIRALDGPVWAPWPEPDGHEHHNAIGELASDLLPAVTYYTTYTPAGRTTGTPVDYEDGWPDLKLAALDCYPSQRSRIVAHLERGLEEYTL